MIPLATTAVQSHAGDKEAQKISGAKNILPESRAHISLRRWKTRVADHNLTCEKKGKGGPPTQELCSGKVTLTCHSSNLHPVRLEVVRVRL